MSSGRIKFFISFRGKSGSFQILENSRLSTVLQIFAKSVGFDQIGALIFEFGGVELFGDETPKELAFIGEEVVFARLRRPDENVV